MLVLLFQHGHLLGSGGGKQVQLLLVGGLEGLKLLGCALLMCLELLLMGKREIGDGGEVLLDEGLLLLDESLELLLFLLE